MRHDATEAERLTVYVTESSRHAGQPLFQWLLAEALRLGLSGATATRGLAGFGHHRRLHHAHLVDLSSELPVIIEVIDSHEQIDAFLACSAQAFSEHTYTRQTVWLHRPRQESEGKPAGR